MDLRGSGESHETPRRESAGICESDGRYGRWGFIDEFLREQQVQKYRQTSIAHFFSSAIDNYIIFIRITFWIYSVNSLEGFLAVAETFVIFIFLHPKAS